MNVKIRSSLIDIPFFIFLKTRSDSTAVFPLPASPAAGRGHRAAGAGAGHGPYPAGAGAVLPEAGPVFFVRQDLWLPGGRGRAV